MKITTQYCRNLSQFSSVCAGMVVHTHENQLYRHRCSEENEEGCQGTVTMSMVAGDQVHRSGARTSYTNTHEIW
jgi:hypothetical protein